MGTDVPRRAESIGGGPSSWGGLYIPALDVSSATLCHAVRPADRGHRVTLCHARVDGAHGS